MAGARCLYAVSVINGVRGRIIQSRLDAQKTRVHRARAHNSVFIARTDAGDAAAAAAARYVLCFTALLFFLCSLRVLLACGPFKRRGGRLLDKEIDGFHTRNVCMYICLCYWRFFLFVAGGVQNWVGNANDE